jgi:hypothetical protein
MSKNYVQQIIDPKNPNGPKIEATIPASLILNYYKFHPVRYENLVAAKFVLENPKRIFSGIRQFNEGGWCFTGKPKSWKVKEQVTAAFPDKFVFAVYLNSRFVLYECRAEIADNNDDCCPEDWENRYGALVWKSTS